MIKKLLLSVIAIAFANSLMAQELSPVKKGQWINLNKVKIEKPVRTTTPLTRAASSYIWWGYPDGGGYVNLLGFDMLSEMLNGGEILKGQKNYNLAMVVPASFSGASVDSVSIGFWESARILCEETIIRSTLHWVAIMSSKGNNLVAILRFELA